MMKITNNTIASHRNPLVPRHRNHHHRYVIRCANANANIPTTLIIAVGILRIGNVNLQQHMLTNLRAWWNQTYWRHVMECVDENAPTLVLVTGIIKNVRVLEDVDLIISATILSAWIKVRLIWCTIYPYRGIPFEMITLHTPASCLSLTNLLSHLSTSYRWFQPRYHDYQKTWGVQAMRGYCLRS